MEEDKIKVKNGNGENISFLKRAVNSYRSKEAVNVVVKYGVFGVLWILLSDTLLEMFAGDFIIYKHLQTYKGGLFVLITMVLVYILVNSRVKKAQNALDESSKAIKDLRHMAYYDTLTGLPNRVMFVSKIKNLIDKSKEEFAIAFIDIDNFKYINDTIGHYAGDDFLKFVGNKISADIRAPNLVAHIGGDEFAILIKNFESKEKVINKLENGIESPIGENGNLISGGEKQRISIARSLLRKSPILILDEATASLDNETAYSIEDTILDMKNTTLISVTHKLWGSLLNKYDKIFVIQDGKIIEQGSFKELIDLKGYFYSLYTIENVNTNNESKRLTADAS